MRNRIVFRYILSEMLPVFSIGLFVFVFILLMFQALRLTEFVLVHGVKLATVLEMMGYLSTSFLPILFPMSLIFTVILTYGRLSSDSEVVALKASGLNMFSIAAPALFLSLLVCIASLVTSFQIAPWGNRQFELLVSKLGAMKPGFALKEGTFAEGFFDLVVFAEKIDSETGEMQHVFIYDERNPESPLTVVSQTGQVIQDPNHPGHEATLRLTSGAIHRTTDQKHTQIDFETYDVQLNDPIAESTSQASPTSMSYGELMASINEAKKTLEEPRSAGWMRDLKMEYHRRIAVSLACILFSIIGVSLGTVTNRRNVKSGGAVLSIGLIVVYWVLHVAAEGMARSAIVPVSVSMWLANFVLAVAAVYLVKRSWLS